jgi:hypothetical protein
MNKAEVRKKLLSMFTEGSVEAWLSKFPDNHVFDSTYSGRFVDYINSLPPAGRHEDE